MKLFVTILIVLTWASCFSQKDDALRFRVFDAHFKENSDTLIHIFPSKYSSDIESKDELDSAFFDSKKGCSFNYHALEKIKMDKKGTLFAYLVGVYNETEKVFSVSILVYSLSDYKLIFQIEGASWKHIEGSAEITLNSWITDIDHDGGKDIAVNQRLIDFEMPTPECPNISRNTMYIYYYKNGGYEYNYWSDGVLKGQFLKK